jgi:hypothetical protein
MHISYSLWHRPSTCCALVCLAFASFGNAIALSREKQKRGAGATVIFLESYCKKIVLSPAPAPAKPKKVATVTIISANLLPCPRPPKQQRSPFFSRRAIALHPLASVAYA